MSRRAARGAALVTLWLYTIVSGFFLLYAPVLPLLLIDHTLYRLVVDKIFSLWQLYPVALFQWIAGCKLHHYGDYIDPEETCIIIMNHRTRVDWNYAWIALYHASRKLNAEEGYGRIRIEDINNGTKINNAEHSRKENVESRGEEYICKEEFSGLQGPEDETSKESKNTENTDMKSIKYTENGNFERRIDSKKSIYENLVSRLANTAKLKYVLKDEIKFIPALGWIMQLNFFLFLKRNWSEDQRSVSAFIDYYRHLQRRHGYNIQLLIFPEGTDLSLDNRRASDAYAVANNLQTYDFVLHPRSTGFAVLTSRMRDSSLAAVYDVTLAYDRPPASELSLARGDLPELVYVHVKRFPAGDLPRGEDRLRRWLNERWQEKENSLRYFHQNGTFEGGAPNRPRGLSQAILAFIFWSAVDAIFLGLVLHGGLFSFWMTYNAILFAAVTWKLGGFQAVQSSLLSCGIRDGKY